MSLAPHPTRGADSAKGERLFRACAACHTTEPGRHLTGPSLAGVFGRTAGTEEGFRRYSDALKSADLVWDETTLDAWLANPRALVPGPPKGRPVLLGASMRATAPS
ncbi:MAG TPA: c-type cytochrome [Alphaproteobacteria bacterium]|nr:c-type cytochrome [Alphaproteobacteria bacterium]